MSELGADASLAPLQAALSAAQTGHAQVGTFQWPWEIARRGGQYFSQLSGTASALTSAATAVIGSPAGGQIVAAVSGDPKNSANTDQVLDNGLFGPAIDAVKADSLLRTMFIGFSGGAQVGLVGGGGGNGVASDVVSPTTKAPISYGEFKLGIGAQVSAGLLVGAMAVQPSHLSTSTCTFEFGAGLVGIGTFVQVLMTDNLDLLGFTVNVGAGGGFSSAVGYGSLTMG